MSQTAASRRARRSELTGQTRNLALATAAPSRSPSGPGTSSARSGCATPSRWASAAARRPARRDAGARRLAGADPRRRPDRPVRRPRHVPVADARLASRSCCWSPSPATPDSFPLMLVFGFFLGIAGTTFAVGIPFVNAWFRGRPARLRHRRLRRRAWAAPRCRRSSRRGSSRGSATRRRTSSSPSPWRRPRRSAGRGCATRRSGRPNTDPVVPKLAAAAASCRSRGRCPSCTPSPSVASSPSPPTCRPTSRTSTPSTYRRRHAHGRLRHRRRARPPDRRHPVRPDRPPCRGRDLARRAAVLALVRRLPTAARDARRGCVRRHGGCFLGLGTGGVFAWVARRAPAERVGSVTGHRRRGRRPRRVLPAAGHGRDLRRAAHTYGVGLVLLAIVAASALVFVLTRLRGGTPPAAAS